MGLSARVEPAISSDALLDDFSTNFHESFLGSFHGSTFTSMKAILLPWKVRGSFRELPYNLTYFHLLPRLSRTSRSFYNFHKGSPRLPFDLLPWTFPPTSVEVNFLPWKISFKSMEADFLPWRCSWKLEEVSFHGSL